ncbi:Sodium-coupled monocarboxylate transporter 1-like 7, partial [Homarus americanus]
CVLQGQTLTLLNASQGTSQHESMADSNNTSGPNFTPIDIAVFSIMLTASVLIGVYSGLKGRVTTTQEYLLGSRNLSPIPVLFSLLGGVISAISVLGQPSEIYMYGTQLIVLFVGLFPVCIFIHQVTLPILYNLKLVSINELLYNLILMGICLYAPSLALSTVTNLSTTTSIVILGVICTFYTSIGGVKAVVYTDVLQTSLMFLGLLAVVVICCLDLGGVGNVWTIADRGSRLQFFNFDPNPFVRHTFWSTMLLGVHIFLYLAAFNQITFQRLASVNTLQTSQRLCLAFVFGIIILWVLFFFSGLVAYAVYEDCDPLTSGKIEKPDQIIPFLVTDKLRNLPGMCGVFVAAIYGAVLSSISSTGNSMTCFIWQDFLKGAPFFRNLGEAGATNTLKVISLAIGAISIGLGMLAGKFGSVFVLISKLSSVIGGPLNGVFIAGICTPWVNAKGVMVGCVTSFVFNIWILIGTFISGKGGAVPLSLSTEGCSTAVTNASTVVFLNTSLTETQFNNTYLVHSLLDNTSTRAPSVNIISDNESRGDTIYDISYCYSGVMSIVMTLILANFVSLLTGPLSPSSHSEGVVSPSCGRFHQWVWQLWYSSTPHSQHNAQRPQKGQTSADVILETTGVVP